MGNRANFIIRQQGKVNYYYDKWGSVYLAARLYRGEEWFLRYAKASAADTFPRDPIMLEAAVLLDFDQQLLVFWAWEMPMLTSVIHYYCERLAAQWPGWEIHYTANGMQEIDALLQLHYYEVYAHIPLHADDRLYGIEENDLYESEEMLVAIREDDHVFATMTLAANTKEFFDKGAPFIDALWQQSPVALPREDLAPAYCVAIDMGRKHIVISESIHGLWDAVKAHWPGYTFTMGFHGYLKTLQLAGISTEGLEMEKAMVQEKFEACIKDDYEIPAPPKSAGWLKTALGRFFRF